MSHNERYFGPAKTVLLTGAGFTKPFGGFLADEMWAVILNQPEIRQYPDLRKCMLEELNYETLYGEVLASDHYGDAKIPFANAIRSAYQHMHQNISRSGLESRSRACRVCTDFIRRFIGRKEKREKGFVFTLNHDLCVEQFCSSSTSFMKIPGLHNSEWFKSQPEPKVTGEDLVSLPDAAKVEQEKSRFWAKSPERLVYLKLHGSYLWRVHDGSDIMVIGHRKTKIIENESLLN